MKNVVIEILGFPGSGKYTIAKELCRKNACFRLVDNHLINNPVFSLINADGHTPLPGRVWENVDLVWQAVKDTLIHLSPREYSFVLTNALLDNVPKDRAHYEDVLAMAQARGATFIPVRILCSVEEMERRIVSEERALRFKETNVNAPRAYKQTHDILNVEHKNLLNLDVTELSVGAAAEEILAHARNIVGE